MIVISDASPIHYLILIDLEDLLPRLLGEIAIPEMVYKELQDIKTPPKILNYFKHKPDWLSIMPDTGVIDDELSEIDPGEREAILLAETIHADGILIDDLAGRNIAFRRGLRVLGTIGLLELAAKQGLVNFLDTLKQIKAEGFYLSPTLEAKLRLKHNDTDYA